MTLWIVPSTLSSFAIQACQKITMSKNGYISPEENRISHRVFGGVNEAKLCQ
jgi:hypothetical protein